MLYRAGPSPSLLNLKLTSEAMPGIKIQKNIFLSKCASGTLQKRLANN